MTLGSHLAEGQGLRLWAVTERTGRPAVILKLSEQISLQRLGRYQSYTPVRIKISLIRTLPSRLRRLQLEV